MVIDGSDCVGRIVSVGDCDVEWVRVLESEFVDDCVYTAEAVSDTDGVVDGVNDFATDADSVIEDDLVNEVGGVSTRLKVLEELDDMDVVHDLVNVSDLDLM